MSAKMDIKVLYHNLASKVKALITHKEFDYEIKIFKMYCLLYFTLKIYLQTCVYAVNVYVCTILVKTKNIIL